MGVTKGSVYGPKTLAVNSKVNPGMQSGFGLWQLTVTRQTTHAI